MRIADRYVLTEALGPFLVALGAFVILITGHMLFQVVEVIVEHGVPLPSVLRFVALQVPHALVMALPVSVLMGCSLAVNRLASDHEIVSMRAGGMSFARMMAPMWGLGVVATLATLAVSEAAVPWSRAEAESLIREMVLRRQSLAFEPGQFTDTGQGLHIYVGDRVAGEQELRDVLIFMMQRNDYPLLFAADRAVFRGERLYPLSPKLLFFDGESVTTLRSAGVEVDLRQVATGAAGGISGPLGMGEMTIRDLRAEYEMREEQAAGAGRSWALEMHSRLAMAVSCLVFAALAGPVTLRFARGQSLVGVMVAMVVTFGYFLVMIWTRQLGEAGALPVAVAAWAENVILIAAAALGLHRLR
ncbi:MAG: LptF/LptG family permease [Armatimonadota bacterium]